MTRSQPGAVRPEPPSFEPRTLRRLILRMAHRGQSVHVACAFSLVEILSVLHRHFLRYDPVDPESATRDYLILSKGHGVMALYACLREIGWIRDEQIDGYFCDGSALRGLCEADIPGCEVTSGSLGHGLPIATGIAYGLKRIGSPRRVFCVVGDGEMNEGPMWESLLFAGQHRLDNLLVIVDSNGFQAMGKTEDVLSMEPFAAKFTAFGCHAAECDGHDPIALREALGRLVATGGRPTALIARTAKGHGVSFMVNDNRWHYTRLSDDTYARALKELA